MIFDVNARILYEALVDPHAPFSYPTSTIFYILLNISPFYTLIIWLTLQINIIF